MVSDCGKQDEFLLVCRFCGLTWILGFGQVIDEIYVRIGFENENLGGRIVQTFAELNTPAPPISMLDLVVLRWARLDEMNQPP